MAAARPPAAPSRQPWTRAVRTGSRGAGYGATACSGQSSETRYAQTDPATINAPRITASVTSEKLSPIPTSGSPNTIASMPPRPLVAQSAAPTERATIPITATTGS